MFTKHDILRALSIFPVQLGKVGTLETTLNELTPTRCCFQFCCVAHYAKYNFYIRKPRKSLTTHHYKVGKYSFVMTRSI